MKQTIKDNRVDNFCEVFGFEYDSGSGLYLPEGTTFSAPSLNWVGVDRASGPDRTVMYYGQAARTFSNELPSRSDGIKLFDVPHPTGVNRDLSDELQQWLDDMEDE